MLLAGRAGVKKIASGECVYNTYVHIQLYIICNIIYIIIALSRYVTYYNMQPLSHTIAVLGILK